MIHRRLLWILAALLMLSGCDADTENTSDTSTDMGTDTVPTTCNVSLVDNPDFAGAFEASVYTAGTFANAIAIEGDSLLVVNSGDNTVQKINLTDGTSTPAFIDTGDGSNPYDLAVSGDRVYVTNLFTGGITVAQLSDGTILSQDAIPQLISPQDIIATDSHLFIANTEFIFGSAATEFGSLAIFTREDTPQLVSVIPTTQPNPQYLLLDGTTLYVVNSGRLSYDPDTFVATPVGDGGVDVFDVTNPDAVTAPTQNFVLPANGSVGNPGVPALSGSHLYIGSGVAPVLFKLDLGAGTVVNGTDNPIPVFTTEAANSLTAPFTGPGNVLYVLDFNNDGLFLFDPSCDAPISERINIGTNAELAEGPLTLLWRDDAALILSSISSEIHRFTPGGLF